MKILLTYMSYLPNVGGVWTYVRELKKGLEKQGHTVDVFAWHPSKEYYYKMESERKIDYKILHAFAKEKVHSYYDQNFPKVDNWIRNHEIKRYTFELAAALFGLADYDIIHAQCARSAIAISRVKPPHIPLISSPHSHLIHELFLSKGKNVNNLHKKYIAHIEFLGCYLSHKTIVASHSLKKQLLNLGGNEEHFEVVPYGIDFKKFQDDMKKNESSLPFTRKKIFVCPARLAYEKGHTFLIDALALLKKEHQDWTCWIIGDGENRAKLERKVCDLQLQDDVIFLGNRMDVPFILNRADFLVLPSLHENLPFAIMEAQIAGLPVIASKTGGIPEMVTHGVTGLLSLPSNYSSLFENLRLVLDYPHFANTLGKNAQKWAMSAWPIDLSISRTLTAYQKNLTIDRQSISTIYQTNPSPKEQVTNESLLSKYYQQISTIYKIPDPRIIRFFENHLNSK